MEIKFLEREAFTVCGWSVETDEKNNDTDIAGLYRDFFEGGREQALMALPGCKKGYYGLSWYTQGHERYCYLLGKETVQTVEAPADALCKTVPGSMFAVATLQDSKEIKQAWTEFYFAEIPKQGYSPNEAHGYYLEYYPQSVHGTCELWVPVVRKV